MRDYCRKGISKKPQQDGKTSGCRSDLQTGTSRLHKVVSRGSNPRQEGNREN